MFIPQYAVTVLLHKCWYAILKQSINSSGCIYSSDRGNVKVQDLNYGGATYVATLLGIKRKNFERQNCLQIPKLFLTKVAVCCQNTCHAAPQAFVNLITVVFKHLLSKHSQMHTFASMHSYIMKVYIQIHTAAICLYKEYIHTHAYTYINNKCLPRCMQCVHIYIMILMNRR